LFKKGDVEICDNYRGISLLSIPSKVLAKILYQRIETKVESQLHEAQCGFRKGRGCVDQIFNLKECISLARQKGKSLYMCFVDLRKAYDSVNRDLLWKAMREYGVSEKIIKIVNSLYENTRAKVRVKGKLSEFLSLKTGVKQGCVLSPLLFNIFIDWVVRKVMNNVGNTGIEIRYSKQRKWLHLKGKELTEKILVNMLMYADDMVIIDTELRNVERFMRELDRQLLDVGMMMNVKKTKMMCLNGEIKELIKIRGEKVEVENSFPYLGVSIKATQSSSCEEVAVRIAKATKVFRALYHPLWKRKQVSMETKVAIYRTAVVPVLLYGSETWVLSVKESSRLEVFNMRCVRVIAGVTKFDHKTNEELREKTGISTVEELVTQNRLRWLGHVARMSEDRLPPQILYGQLEGKNKMGRPVGRWRDMVQGDIRKRNIVSWYSHVQNRVEWRKIVKGEVNEQKGRRKLERKEEDSNRRMRRMTEALKCMKCGKEYRGGKRGGHYQRHIEVCDGRDKPRKKMRRERDEREMKEDEREMMRERRETNSRRAVASSSISSASAASSALSTSSASSPFAYPSSSSSSSSSSASSSSSSSSSSSPSSSASASASSLNSNNNSNMICQWCGKVYRTKKKWYIKHLAVCGTSRQE
jgi:hypothetical protein